MSSSPPFPGSLRALDERGNALNWSETTIVDGSPFLFSAVTSSPVVVVFDIDCSGAASLVLEIDGTFTGQAIAVEVALSGGYSILGAAASWASVQGKPLAGLPTILSGQTAPGLSSGATGATTIFKYPVAGAMRVRLRVAALASGAMTFVAALSTSIDPLWIATSGVVPHASTIAGYPLRIGARARSALLGPVTNDQASDLVTTLDGKLVTQPFTIPDLAWSYAGAAGGIVTTTAATLKTAGAAGVRNYLRGLQLRNAGTTETEVTVLDGGTVIWRGDLPTGAVELPSFDPPLRGTAATAMTFACVTAGAKVYLNAQGFQGT